MVHADGTLEKEKLKEAAEVAAEKVRKGTYYQEALDWYHDVYEAPIMERVPILIVFSIFVVIGLFSLHSFFSIMPIRETKSIVVTAQVEGFPQLVPLLESPLDDPNPPIISWHAKTFVYAWEGYNFDKFEESQRLVRGMATQPVYNKYRQYYIGTDSPALKYERHTKRLIEPRRVTLVGENQAQVEFLAIEESLEEDKKSLWRADITFAYKQIRIDQNTGIITPMQFEVTDYKVEKIG